MSISSDQAPFRILVIKTGLSETLYPNLDGYPSLGDIVRTTPVIPALREHYPNSHLTWLTSKEGQLLLQNQPAIDQVLSWGNQTRRRLRDETFDLVMNLEKSAQFLELVDRIDPRIRIGFSAGKNGVAYEVIGGGAAKIKDYIASATQANRNYWPWPEMLVELTGVPWKKQPYAITQSGLKDSIRRFDVGLNYLAGSKWPTKLMPMPMWQELERLLKSLGYSVSWQKGARNLGQYLKWIRSCRLLISQDSLGLHIAIADQSPVIGLFGPTSPGEIHFHSKGCSITSPLNCDYMPCYANVCKNRVHCMESIDPDDVVAKVCEYLQLEQQSIG